MNSLCERNDEVLDLGLPSRLLPPIVTEVLYDRISLTCEDDLLIGCVWCLKASKGKMLLGRESPNGEFDEAQRA